MAQKFLYRSMRMCCGGEVFTVRLPRNSHLFLLHYSGLSPSNHKIKQYYSHLNAYFLLKHAFKNVAGFFWRS
jgi:hypothetical protein